MSEGSRGTVIVAGVANLLIALAKGAAGLLTGSSALLAESAHSFADTLNEAFLMTALTRSRKPADALHPFGYGKERYFWSLLAAAAIFVLGAGFSFLEGGHALASPQPIGSLPIAYGVLAVAFVFEGASWLKAVRQLRGEADRRRIGMLRHVATSTDLTAKTVAFEDTAALIGLVLAALGITLDALTGSGRWDGVASVLIGLLLLVVAFSLGRQNMQLLIGESLPEEVRKGVQQVITESTGVHTVVEVLSMRLGPDEVLVAARVDVDDATSGGDLEQVAEDVDRRIRDAYPEVRHVFLDPTPAGIDDKEDR